MVTNMKLAGRVEKLTRLIKMVMLRLIYIALVTLKCIENKKFKCDKFNI